MVKEVDLRSDTVTKPTAAMRRAMAEAIVGDDVHREDSTVIELEHRIADLLGKEDALFVPSGTMGNLSSVMSHCWTRGLEVMLGDQSHIFIYEQGGVSQLGGVHVSALATRTDGTFDMEEVANKIRPSNPRCHEPYTGLICLENTHNRCGGRVLPLSFIEQVCSFAHRQGVPVHMDGARILNASVHSGVAVKEIVKNCDSISMCLSKGIGAPVGSVVAGSSEFIGRVMRCRKVLGGGMRQAGVLAAAGLVALDTARERIQVDHLRAKRLAQALQVSQRDGVLDTRQMSTSCGSTSHFCSKAVFSSGIVPERGSQDEIVLPRALDKGSISDLYRIKVKRSGWPIHAANVLTFQLTVVD